MLGSPQILVWFRDQIFLKIPKVQWHHAHLVERPAVAWAAVAWAAVVESADFAA